MGDKGWVVGDEEAMRVRLVFSIESLHRFSRLFPSVSPAFSRETWPRCSPELLNLPHSPIWPEDAPRIDRNPFPLLPCQKRFQTIFALTFQLGTESERGILLFISRNNCLLLATL
jgi:hypothetical protein